MRNNFSDLASQWRWDTPTIQADTRILEVSIVFDHDYLTHVLFCEWDTSVQPHALGYTLYFYGEEPVAIPVAQWENNNTYPKPPYTECATLVEDWRALFVESSH